MADITNTAVLTAGTTGWAPKHLLEPLFHALVKGGRLVQRIFGRVVLVTS